MMRTTIVLAIGILAIGLGATAIFAGGREADVPLKDVPEAVKQAALEAIPGIRLEEAEVEREGGRLVYDLEGILDGKTYEILAGGSVRHRAPTNVSAVVTVNDPGAAWPW